MSEWTKIVKEKERRIREKERQTDVCFLLLIHSDHLLKILILNLIYTNLSKPSPPMLFTSCPQEVRGVIGLNSAIRLV